MARRGEKLATEGMNEAHEWPALNVELRALDRVQVNERNPRRHGEEQIARLQKAIHEFGFTMPLLVDEHGTLIAGHARYAAALGMGLAQVPVATAHGWTDQQKRAYIIADNRLSELASWDYGMLAEELNDLRELDVDMNAIGYSESELNRLLGQVKTLEPPGEFREYDESIETNMRCPRCGYEWQSHDLSAEQE